MRHFGIFPRSPWNMIGWKNWVQKLLNDQMDKLCSSLKVPIWTNQIQTQIMIERSNPLSGVTWGSRKVEEKRPVPKRSKHVLFMKKLLNMIERSNPLSAVTHITSQEHTEHVHLMTARASTLKIKQHMIEREPSNEQSLLNEVNIDFRILGMPHYVVKQAQNSRVRELVKKIENHPHRHSLQRDLQPNEAYTPFSTMTKQMIQNVGNVRFFELFETDPKTQCTESLTVCMRHDEWGTKSRHLSHIVMCKESNEDDTKETLQTNKRHSRVFKCFSRECTHASSLRPRFYVLLCLLLCFVSSIQSSSVFPRLHFSLVCEFLVILCNCSHCENVSFEVLSLQLQHGSKLSTIEMCDQCHLCKISWKKCTIPLIGSVFTRNRLCKQCWMDFRSICMVSCQNMQVVREQSHDQDFGWWREKNQLPSCVRLHNHHGYGTFIVIVSKTWPDVDILFLVWNGLAVKINSSGEDLQHKGVRSIPFDVDEDLCHMYRDKLVHFSAP